MESMFAIDKQRHNEQAMNVRLLALVGSRPPTWVAPSSSILIALQTMHAAKVGSLVICEQMGKPQGILTSADLVERLILPKIPLETPISTIMTPQPYTLPAEDTAYDAALLMTEHGIRHVIVVDNMQRLLGVVSERDLFTLQGGGLSQLRRAIDRAYNRQTLVGLAEDIRKLATNLQQQGIDAEQITQFISLLNDALTRRIIQLNVIDSALPDVPWCWLAFGSEGRDEQTFSTDQDNGLIFQSQNEAESAALRPAFLQFAKKVNQDLDACGFPLCQGEIMASNPAWCLSLAEWQQRFTEWILQPFPPALLNASIFFDFRPLSGQFELAQQLRQHLLNLAPANQGFLRAMAVNALDISVPLNWWGGLKTETQAGEECIDLKKFGSRLVVDAARILALAEGIAATNTRQRLQQLKEGQRDMAAAVRSLSVLQTLRLQHQCQQRAQGTAADNMLVPKNLNRLDRRMLINAFEEIKKLQLQLRLKFQVH